MFKSTSNQNLDEIKEWSRWAENYDLHSQVLTDIVLGINTIYDNLNKADICCLIDNLTKAIKFFEQVPDKTNEYWNEIIEKLKKEQKSIIDTKDKKEKIEEKFNKLLRKIEESEFYDVKILEMEREIIIIILSFVEVFNEKEYLNSQQIFEQLLSSYIPNNEKVGDESICWPQIESKESITETKNIKIFDSLIFYSKVKSLLKEIQKTDNIVSILTKLRDFPEMSCSIKLMITDLIQCENEKIIISDENVKYAQYTMEASLLMKLYRISDKILLDPHYLCDFINNFEKRDSCNDEDDIRWLYNTIKEISPNFVLSMPSFDPNSLVFLVINKINNDNYVSGPLLSNISDIKITLIENQSILLNSKFDSFIDAANSIGQIFYNSFISSNEIPPQNYTDIKDVFNRSYQISEIKLEIIDRLKILFSIAESLENWKKPNLTFNDTFFLSMNWEQLLINENLLSNYPSLLFWIYKNKKCAEQIRKLYHDFEPNKKKIPIWLVYLRLISSNQCIKFDSNSQTKVSKIINDTVISCIFKFLDEKSHQKNPKKIDWINILIDNTSTNKKIRIFHDFLYNLSFDDLDNQSEKIAKWKHYFIAKSISILVFAILLNHQDIIEANFFDLSSIANFLCYPSKHIQNKIDHVLNNHENEPLFRYKYDLFDISKLNQKIFKFSFSDKIDKNMLAQPLFYLSLENEIKCTINKLVCQIGPLFHSLLSDDPISINLSSAIDEKIILSIDCPRYSHMIYTKEKIKNKKPIQIFIKPQIKNKNKKKIKMTGNLKMNIEGNNNEYKFPFDITLILLPIKVLIQCEQYSLSEIENNYFRLCCDQINSEEILNFELINYYIPEFLILNFKIVPCEENQADEPIAYFKEKTKSLILYIPYVDKATRCKFDIIIKFSHKLETKIHCDFVIRPIIFIFEMFDCCKKAFSNDCNVVLIKQDYIQYLHFRILSPYSLNKNGKISYKLPNFVNIEGSTLKTFQDGNYVEFYDFEVNEYFYFDIIIGNSSQQSSLDNYYFMLDIAGITKTIQLTFINSSDDLFDPNNENVSDQYINNFPCYSYIFNDERWEKIKSNDDFQEMKKNDSFYVIATPFSWYPNKEKFIIINYNQENNNDISISNQNKSIIKYIQISNDRISSKISQSSIEVEKTVEKKYFYFVKQKNISYYSIIGFIEEDPDEWFPIIDQYPDISEKDLLLYSDDKENISKASQKIDEISKFYNKSPCGDSLISFLTEKNVNVNINSLITLLPNSIKLKLDLILNEIIIFNKLEDNIQKQIQIIVSNNLIITFLSVFKQRYIEIKSNKFCLQMKIPEILIQKQIDKSYSELMYFNEDMNHEINSEIKSLFEKEKDMLNQINVTPLAKKSKHCVCMLINENKPSKSLKLSTIKKMEYDEYFNEKSIFDKTCDTINFSLPSIDVIPNHSLSSYIDFISACSLGSVLLPVFIFHHLVKEKNLDQLERYFAILYNLYKEITKESPDNKSVLSHSVNQFIEYFEICLNKLAKAGVSFVADVCKEDLDKCKYIYRELISIPNIDLPSI